jgi:DNA polymerase-1
MSRILFDIEGDGLLPSLTTIWCIVAMNVDTGFKSFFTPSEIEKGIEYLKKQDCLIGHNIIGYDLKALWKLYGEWDEVPLIVDTLVTSRCLWPERTTGHSLDAWGKRLGYEKIEFDDYSQYSTEMLTYCERDVELNVKVLEALEEEHGDTLTGFKVYN